MSIPLFPRASKPKSIRQHLTIFLVIGNLTLAAGIWWGHTWNHNLAHTIEHNQSLHLLSQTTSEFKSSADNAVIALLEAKASLRHPEEAAKAISRQQQHFRNLEAELDAMDINHLGHGNIPSNIAGYQKIFHALNSTYQTLAKSEQRFLEVLQRDTVDTDAMEQATSDLHALHRLLGAALQDLIALSVIEIEHHSDVMTGKVTNANYSLKIILLLAIPLSFLLAFLVIRKITKPLMNLNENIKAIVEGNGDISAQLPEGSGEAGELARQYNKLTVILQASLLQVAEVGQHIKTSSSQLTHNAEHTRLGLIGQNAEVQDVVDKMNAMEESVHSIEESTTTAAAAAEDTYSKCQSSQQLMTETVQTMHQLDNEAAETIDKMGRMASSVDAISTVIEVINKVAEQTNLLALNAAIEAARAGESGRGFAVVAEEVRNLAIRTQESTNEVNQIIEELKASARASGEAIDNNRKYVTDALGKVGEMANALRDIDDSTREIASMTGQISNSLTQQAEFAADINRNTVNLKMTTRQAETNAKTMESLGNKLDDLVNRLNFALGTFNVGAVIDSVMTITGAEGGKGTSSTPNASSAALAAPSASEDTGDIELF